MADFQHALETFRLARKMLSEILSSCELIDEDCLNPVVQTLGVRNPLSEHPFYVLIEVSGSNAAHDEEKLNAFLESAMGEGIVSDGTVTNEPSRMQVNRSCYNRLPFILQISSQFAKLETGQLWSCWAFFTIANNSL